MDTVRGFVLDNAMSETAIPDILQGFEHDVSQAHTQTSEEYIHFLYTIGLVHEYIFSVPGPGDPFWGSFDALDGSVRNLATLIRTGDCNIDIDDVNGILVVSGNLGLSELRVSHLSALISFD